MLPFNTGDNLLRSWSFHVWKTFMPERMALNLTAQKHRWRLRMVGILRCRLYYLYGAPAIGNTCRATFLRPLRDAVAGCATVSSFGNIAEEMLFAQHGRVQPLDKGGRGEVVLPASGGAFAAAGDSTGQPAGVWRSSDSLVA